VTLVASPRQAARASLGVLVVTSPPEESRAFFLSQGFHSASAAPPGVRTALRRLDQSGQIVVHSAMARAAPLAMDGSAAAAVSQGVSGALHRLGRPAAPGLTAAQAAARLGYTECTRCFVRGRDGSCDAVQYSEGEQLPAAFRTLPYARLQAFDTLSARGWGLRSSVEVPKGTVVVEVLGLCLDAHGVGQLDSLEYVVGFDDRTMEAKARLGDTLQYIDCRTHGNLMRLVNGAPGGFDAPCTSQHACSYACTSLHACSYVLLMRSRGRLRGGAQPACGTGRPRTRSRA
jgi:hypothetical protein